MPSKPTLVRFALWFWVAAGLITWNATFDLLVTRGVKQYLYRNAEHQAGLGPPVSIDEIMIPTVRDAAVTASIAALCVTGSGLGTVWLLAGARE